MNELSLPPAVELREQVGRLEALGAQLTRDEQHEDAERIFREIVRVAPRHASALHYLGGRALLRGDLDEAQTLFERTIRIAPRAAMTHQNLGIVLRARGYPEGALQAFDIALKLRPDLTMAWVQRGDVLQALARREEAVASYKRAEDLCGDLRILVSAAPEASRTRRSVQRALVHLARARLTVAAEALAPLGRRDAPSALERIEPTIRHMCHAARPAYADPLQQPAYAYVPGLDARPFFERGEFPFLAALEQKTDAIRRELRDVLTEREELAPYVQMPKDHEGLWRELNRSPKWSSYHLYREGVRVPAHCERCPQTLAAVEALPLVRMEGHAPEIFFSILEPGTHIPPHHGIANYKLAVHLPLVIPPRCSIRVGDETRTWKPGKCLVFDDSYEHEAWNRSGELRAVLIFEVWNPALSAAEREALATAQTALSRFNRKMAALAGNSLSARSA
ncbi:MAG: aspartyl/asparaginyl beta-hydroxylase domain-containing protein [Gammaproteobacteria bacterium]